MNKRLLAVFAAAALALPASAFAVDGCKVLLCLAGNWKGIAACVPPVRQALWDMARGRAYPHCDMSRGGPPPIPGQPDPTRAENKRPTEESCPVMYSRYSRRTGEWQSCRYSGVISIVVEGQPWSEVFWDGNGGTSTRYSASARAKLGTNIDPTYDRDLAACGRCEPPPIIGPER